MRGRTEHILSGLLLCLLIGACASTGPEDFPVATTLSGAEVADLGDGVAASPGRVAFSADELLPWIESRAYLKANRARRLAGLADLEMRMDLMELARIHAVDMARRDYFSHYSPEGAGPGDRARSLGIRYRAFAENLARVRFSADPATLAVEGWLGSPGHRRNLLDEGGAGYRYTGIGVAEGADGAIYLSQVFLR